MAMRWRSSSPTGSGWLLAWPFRFRLPREILQRDIDYIRKMGVTIKTGMHFGADVDIWLQRMGQCVIVATGIRKPEAAH